MKFEVEYISIEVQLRVQPELLFQLKISSIFLAF